MLSNRFLRMDFKLTTCCPRTLCVPFGFPSVRRYNFTPNFTIPSFFYWFEIILLPFKNLNLIPRTLKIQEPTKTSFSHMHSWISIQQVLGRCFPVVFSPQQVTNLSFVICNSTTELLSAALLVFVKQYYPKTGVIRCHPLFFELLIFRTNCNFPREFEKAGFHCSLFTYLFIYLSVLRKFRCVDPSLLWQARCLSYQASLINTTQQRTRSMSQFKASVTSFVIFPFP